MNVSGPIDVPIEALIGALLTDREGGEMGCIIDVRFDLTNHIVVVCVDGPEGEVGLQWPSLRDYSIYLQR